MKVVIDRINEHFYFNAQAFNSKYFGQWRSILDWDICLVLRLLLQMGNNVKKLTLVKDCLKDFIQHINAIRRDSEKKLKKIILFNSESSLYRKIIINIWFGEG